MALAFWVDGRPDGVAAAFAAHDEYTAIFGYFFRGGEDKTRPLTPADAFFTAPCCFLPKHRDGGFIIFTPGVPWLHGNPFENLRERAHHRAHEWMRDRGRAEAPHLGTLEVFQRTLKLEEGDVYTFTEDGAYPATADVNCALEDRAVAVTCAAMGWPAPADWRGARARLAETHGLPLLDLADWEKRAAAAVPPRPESGARADAEEEKKDPAGEGRV